MIGTKIGYIAPNGTLMAVSLSTTGGTPEVGIPVALFRPRTLYGAR